MGQLLSTNSAKLPLLTTPEKEAFMLKLIDAAALMDFSEDVMRAMELSREAMNVVCYIYDADCYGIEELCKANARKN